MSWKHIFMVVSGCALAGMLMGGLFGFGAGKITPGFFKSIIPWESVEPVGFATFLGATAGVILGGALGGFALILQAITKSRAQTNSTQPPASSER